MKKIRKYLFVCGFWFMCLSCVMQAAARDAWVIDENKISNEIKDAFQGVETEMLSVPRTRPVRAPAPVYGAPRARSLSSDEDKKEIKVMRRPVTLNLQSMPLVQILRAISIQTGANFIIARELQNKKFSLFLEDVPMREALRALLESHHMGYERMGNSNSFVVKEMSKTKTRLITRIFRLKYTQLSPSSGSGSDEGGGPEETMALIAGMGGGGEEKSSEKEEGGGIVPVVRSILTPQGKLQTYAETNSLIVTDVPENMMRIEDIIDSLDTLIPQVLIEAIVLEANADTSRKLGLELGGPDGALAAMSGPSRLLSGENVGHFAGVKELADATVKDTTLYGGNPTMGTFFGMLSFSQFTAVLRAVENTGDGQYLAKPKILTLNNKMAEISITAETAVGIKSASLIAQNGLLTTTAERKDTGITLRVTPQINDGGLITLLLEPTISRPQTSQFFPTQFVDPQTRSIRTTVRVQDGQTVLIGGILSNETTKKNRRVPFFSRIPLLGRLFQAKDDSSAKKELMIFITPRVVKAE